MKKILKLGKCAYHSDQIESLLVLQIFAFYHETVPAGSISKTIPRLNEKISKAFRMTLFHLSHFEGKYVILSLCAQTPFHPGLPLLPPTSIGCPQISNFLIGQSEHLILVYAMQDRGLFK